MKKYIIFCLLSFLVACENKIGNNNYNNIKDDLSKIIHEVNDNKAAKAVNLTGIPLSFQCNNFTSSIALATGNFGNKSSVALTPDAIVEVGSITKSFSAVVILQLANEKSFGDKGLETTVGDILGNPENSDSWRKSWNQVTLRQLLNHTSGIVDYLEALWGGDSYDPSTQYTTDELLEYAVKGSTQYNDGGYFKPGQGWHYSNTNYAILNKIVQRVTNNDMQYQIEQRIIKPLKLDHTYYTKHMPLDAITKDDQKQLLMHGFLTMGNANKDVYVNQDVYNWSLSFGNAAGALLSNVVDINKYVRALFFSDVLLNKDQRAELTKLVAVMDKVTDKVSYKAGQELHNLDENTPLGYGLGIFGEYIVNPEKAKDGAVFYFHSGDTLGFASKWIIQADKKASTVWSYNVFATKTDDLPYSKIDNWTNLLIKMEGDMYQEIFNKCQ